ncbi:ABC transporter permease [Modestobacter sp. I12A-02662]|uniref:ABC transporter permease n=1 Tax=Modestobacter sp. I12A-02662 TaxID=1730496 RepID=UPI0034DFF66A
MIRLVRSEWTKLLTTRVWLGLLVAACALAAGSTALLTAFAGDPQSGLPPVDSSRYEQLALATGADVVGLSLILGIIGTTQEYRHRTATPTFLASPRRGRVVVAKLAAYAVAAVPFALAVVAVTLLVVVLHGGARGGELSWTAGNMEVLLRSGLAIVVYAIIGVGVGALLRNQVGAIVGAPVYLFVVEPVIRSIPATAPAYKWMPGGALEAMTATSQGPDLLQAWQGALVLLGYGLLAAVLGTAFAVRRDVV